MTLPNVISLFRLLLIIPYSWLFLIDGNRRIIFAIALIIILSDKLDGWLARKLHSETKLGEVLDAFADGTFVLLSWMFFFWEGVYSLFLLILFLLPRLLIAFSMLVYRLMHKKWQTEHVAPNRIAGVANFFMILWLILRLPWSIPLLWATAVLTYVCLFLGETKRHKL